jgi:hypothetical protein
MTLLIDRSSSSRRLGGPEFRAWCEGQTIFISSEMGELGELRERLAAALRELGFTVVYFENLGGRDEDAETAFLDGVARSSIYLGVIANRYGRMLESGRSATDEEYRAARAEGKRISVWVAADDSSRQGNARDFVQELQTFHTTGNFSGIDDLITRATERLAEIAADDEAPWVKVGDAIFRASVIRDEGTRIEIEAEIREPGIARYLAGLRPDAWNRATEVRITTGTETGKARVEEIVTETRTSSRQAVTVRAAVEWTDGRPDAMAAGTSRYSADDLAELGLRRALLKDSLPAELETMAFLVPDGHPLDELDDAGVTPAAYGPIARLLVIEYALGGGLASHIEDWLVGPPAREGRNLRLAYREAQRYTNVEPGCRIIKGIRPAG